MPGDASGRSVSLLVLVLLSNSTPIVAQTDEPSATITSRTKVKLEILPDPTGADSTERVLGRLHDGFADGQDGTRTAAAYEMLSLVQPDTLSSAVSPSATAAVDILSETSVRVGASTDFKVAAGGSLQGQIRYSANAAVGQLDLNSLGRMSVMSGEDAEFSVGGDVGTTASGSASLAAAQLQTRIAGTGELHSGGNLSISAHGTASLSGESLDANMRGDLSIAGAATHFSSRTVLSVLAGGAAEMKSARGARFAATGAVAELGGDKGAARLESASDFQAVAGNQLRANAEQMVTSATDDVDVTASKSARIASNHLRIMASQNLQTDAGSVQLRASNDVEAFTGGEFRSSLSSVSAESRGRASIVAAGPADLSAESSTFSLSNDLGLTAGLAKLQGDTATLGVSRLSAAAESASLHAADATLSTSGTVSGYMSDADVMVEGQLSLQSNNFKVRTTELSVESSTTQLRASQELSAATGTLKVVAGIGGTETGAAVDIDCISSDASGCDTRTMRAELAELLGVPLSRLAVQKWPS